MKLDPKLPEAYNGVGVTYYARQDLKSAIEWYKKSLRVDPQFGDGYYNLACAYAVDGQLQAGLAYLKLAASKGYTDLDVIERDPDLEALRGLPEYKDILADVRGP